MIRVLSYNQGAAGVGMLGAGALDESLEVGLARQKDIEVEFVGSPTSTFLEKLAARPWWPLSTLDLDWHTARWQEVESIKAYRVITRSIRKNGSPKILAINSHSVSYRLDDIMKAIPTLLHVDVLTEPWANMGIWRQRHVAATLAPSLKQERRVLERATTILAWSNWAAEQVARVAPTARVEVWHPGIDTERYVPAPRRAQTRPYVLFIGGRFVQKGGQNLIEAMSPILGRDADLHIVTPEAVPQHLGVFVHRLGRGDSQLLDLLQQASLLCLPTFGDASPWVILEAMACGIPVVASPMGAIAEMLGDGICGILCPPSVEMLRTTIINLLRNEGQRATLGIRSRAAAVRNYSAAENGQKLAAMIRSLV